MPIIELDQLPVREIFPGLRARLVHTDRVTHSWVDVDAGASFPEHQHPLELVVAGEVHRLRGGMSCVIAPNARHSGRGITACRVLDTFAPARDDYR